MPVLPLLDLIASKGSTVEQLATALGFHPDLIYRVAKGRQPLPRLAAEGIALLLSVSLAEVLAGVPQWTASSDPLAFVPLPPDPALGDPFQLAPISATVLMSPLPPPFPRHIWTVGEMVGAMAGPGGRSVHRDAGSLDLQVTFVDALGPAEIALDGAGKLWTFGTMPSGMNYFAARWNPLTAVVELEFSDPALVAPRWTVAMAGGVWASSTGASEVVRFDELTGALQAVATLTDGMNPHTPQGLVMGSDGKLHAVGVDPMVDGRLFRVEPVFGAIEAVSMGATMGNAFHAATDGADRIWVASATPTDALFEVLVSTYMVAPIAVIGAMIFNPTRVHFFDGHFWVADRDVMTLEPRLLKIDPGTATVVAMRVFVGLSGDLGGITDDGTFVWVSVPNHDLVNKLHPLDLSDILSVAVPGVPRGLRLSL